MPNPLRSAQLRYDYLLPEPDQDHDTNETHHEEDPQEPNSDNTDPDHPPPTH